MSEDLEQRVSELEDTVTSLTEECQRRGDRIDELEAELEERPPLKLKGDYDPDAAGVVLAESLYLNDWAIGSSIKERTHESQFYDFGDEVDERLTALEEDAVTETVEIDREDMLPIARYTHDRKRGDHDLQGNKLRATYVFDEFRSHAVSENGLLKLTSSQVKNIHRDNGLDTNPNTIRRTMRMVAKHSVSLPADERKPKTEENLINYEERTSRNVLIAIKDEWDEAVGLDEPDESAEKATSDETADEWAALDRGEPVTHSSDESIVADGGKDSTEVS